MLAALVEAWRLLCFFVVGLLIGIDDLFFRGRRRFAWREKMQQYLTHPSPQVARKGYWAVVTGANAGLGFETARLLAKAGINVVLACRSTERGMAAEKKIASEAKGGGDVMFLSCDLGDLRSVSRFAEEVVSRGLKVNLLVTNAGVMGTPWATTEQGYEQQFGVHHIGHALLIERLLPTLQESGPSRIVIVGSQAGKDGVFDPTLFERQGPGVPPTYNRYQRYRDAKAANVMHMVNLHERLASWNRANPSRQVTVNALHPGCLATSIAKTLPFMNRCIEVLAAKLFQITVLEGAVYVMQLAVGQAVEGVSGKYYHMPYPGKPPKAVLDPKARQAFESLSRDAIAPYLARPCTSRAP